VDELQELVAQARRAAQRAYAPYSRFRVGAAVRDADGLIFSGCNVESASYGLTVCGERTAVFSAIAAGGRRPFTALALACIDAVDRGAPCVPCGACRQVIAEHLAADAPVSVDGGRTFTVSELLPYDFRLEPSAAPPSP
jgi:cytidine deaminase